MPDGFIVKLDEDAKAEKELEDNNMIIIGGPGTNIVSSEFNKYLPIKFNENNYWSGLIDKSGKLYHLDNLGIIAKIKNPYNNTKNIILIAGVRSIVAKLQYLPLAILAKKLFQNTWEKKMNGLQ